MARPLRPHIPGGVYHVTTRGVVRQAIYRDAADRLRFLAVLGDVVERFNWACHFYCLMGTHYHLLVRTPDANIGDGMKRLNGHYAQGFNRRHGEHGHRFESRYHSLVVERESHVLELSRYLALNPVRAGICRLPEQWRWSSYRAVAGLERPLPLLAVGWLLAQFGANLERARERFCAFVSEGLAEA